VVRRYTHDLRPRASGCSPPRRRLWGGCASRSSC